MNNMNKEYAEALFALSCENNCQKDYSLSLNTVLKFIEETPDYLSFLSSPGIPLGDRLSALDEAFGEILPEYVLSFLKLLCEKSRIQDIRECVAEFDALVDACENITVATVTSAVELSDKQKETLKSRLDKMSGTDVVLECSVDEGLIGGIVVEIDGKVIDGSLRHNLNNVKEVIGK